jgi:hypothetical protein
MKRRRRKTRKTRRRRRSPTSTDPPWPGPDPPWSWLDPPWRGLDPPWPWPDPPWPASSRAVGGAGASGAHRVKVAGVRVELTGAGEREREGRASVREGEERRGERDASESCEGGTSPRVHSQSWVWALQSEAQ